MKDVAKITLPTLRRRCFLGNKRTSAKCDRYKKSWLRRRLERLRIKNLQNLFFLLLGDDKLKKEDRQKPLKKKTN